MSTVTQPICTICRMWSCSSPLRGCRNTPNRCCEIRCCGRIKHKCISAAHNIGLLLTSYGIKLIQDRLKDRHLEKRSRSSLRSINPSIPIATPTFWLRGICLSALFAAQSQKIQNKEFIWLVVICWLTSPPELHRKLYLIFLPEPVKVVCKTLTITSCCWPFSVWSCNLFCLYAGWADMRW